MPAKERHLVWHVRAVQLLQACFHLVFSEAFPNSRAKRHVVRRDIQNLPTHEFEPVHHPIPVAIATMILVAEQVPV